jgi:hypothetical protein
MCSQPDGQRPFLAALQIICLADNQLSRRIDYCHKADAKRFKYAWPELLL